MDVLKAGIYFLYLFCIVSVFSTEIRSYSFHLSKTQKVLYQFVPLHEINGSSASCAILCVEYRRCRGYNLSADTCHLFELRMEISERGKKLPEQSKIYLRKQFESIFGTECMFSRDCNYRNGHCLRGKCACKIGYSYVRTKRTCVKRCHRYGGYFSKYTNSGIIGCNTKEIRATEKNCTHICRNESSWTCINVEYIKGTCQLCNMRWSSIRKKKRLHGKSKDSVLYYRHCQN